MPGVKVAHLLELAMETAKRQRPEEAAVDEFGDDIKQSKKSGKSYARKMGLDKQFGSRKECAEALRKWVLPAEVEAREAKKKKDKADYDRSARARYKKDCPYSYAEKSDDLLANLKQERASIEACFPILMGIRMGLQWRRSKCGQMSAVILNDSTLSDVTVCLAGQESNDQWPWVQWKTGKRRDNECGYPYQFNNCLGYKNMLVVMVGMPAKEEVKDMPKVWVVNGNNIPYNTVPMGYDDSSTASNGCEHLWHGAGYKGVVEYLLQVLSRPHRFIITSLKHASFVFKERTSVSEKKNHLVERKSIDALLVCCKWTEYAFPCTPNGKWDLQANNKKLQLKAVTGWNWSAIKTGDGKMYTEGDFDEFVGMFVDEVNRLLHVWTLTFAQAKYGNFQPNVYMNPARLAELGYVDSLPTGYPDGCTLVRESRNWHRCYRIPDATIEEWASYARVSL